MKKVFACIFWFIILTLMSLWTFEFYRVRNGLDPMFTFNSKTYTYDDGITTESIGLGYKVFKYERSDLYGTEFVSIFGKQRHEEQDNKDTKPIEDENTPDINPDVPIESEPVPTDDGGEVVEEVVE